MLFRSNDTATTEIYTGSYTLSLHDALPISGLDAHIGRHFDFLTFSVAREDLGVIEYVFWKTGILKLAEHYWPGAQNNLEAKFPGQFQKDHQVLSGVGLAAKIKGLVRLS